MQITWIKEALRFKTQLWGKNEIKTVKANLESPTSLKRKKNIKENREEIQFQTSQFHQQHSSPGCNNSRKALKHIKTSQRLYYALWRLALVQHSVLHLHFIMSAMQSVLVHINNWERWGWGLQWKGRQKYMMTVIERRRNGKNRERERERRCEKTTLSRRRQENAC